MEYDFIWIVPKKGNFIVYLEDFIGGAEPAKGNWQRVADDEVTTCHLSLKICVHGRARSLAHSRPYLTQQWLDSTFSPRCDLPCILSLQTGDSKENCWPWSKDLESWWSGNPSFGFFSWLEVGPFLAFLFSSRCPSVFAVQYLIKLATNGTYRRCQWCTLAQTFDDDDDDGSAAALKINLQVYGILGPLMGCC